MDVSPFDDLNRPPLRADALRAALLAPAGPLPRLDVLAEVASTNSSLISSATADPAAWPSRSVLTTDSQIAGKGRLGRTWVAPPRSGLALSMLVRPRTPGSTWSWLPLLAGVAVAATVRAVGGLPATLKWPNDVMVGTCKVAGVLAEAVTGTAGVAAGGTAGGTARTGGAVVLGIGLNVTSSRAELPVTTATSLALEGAASTDRDTLLRALVRSLSGELDRWEDAAGDAEASGLASRVREACSTLGEAVVVDLPDGTQLSGTAEGIDAVGRLLVRADQLTDPTVRAVAAGDVTHVRSLRSQP